MDAIRSGESHHVSRHVQLLLRGRGERGGARAFLTMTAAMSDRFKDSAAFDFRDPQAVNPLRRRMLSAGAAMLAGCATPPGLAPRRDATPQATAARAGHVTVDMHSHAGRV